MKAEHKKVGLQLPWGILVGVVGVHIQDWLAEEHYTNLESHTKELEEEELDFHMCLKLVELRMIPELGQLEVDYMMEQQPFEPHLVCQGTRVQLQRCCCPWGSIWASLWGTGSLCSKGHIAHVQSRQIVLMGQQV